MPKRKPPGSVVSIKGQHEPDVIRQAEMAIVSQLQAAEWLANQSVQAEVLKLLARLRAGARIEAGDLTFDRELRMVRTRKRRAGA